MNGTMNRTKNGTMNHELNQNRSLTNATVHARVWANCTGGSSPDCTGVINKIIKLMHCLVAKAKLATKCHHMRLKARPK